MKAKPHQCLFLILLVAGLSNLGSPGSAAAEPRGGHDAIAAVVTTKAGAMVVKTPQGVTFQINDTMARLHGHEPFKEGDEVTVTVDENNTVIDIHPKGQEAHHTFVTGKLIHLGRMQKEVKLQTPEGEKVFPLPRLEVKTKGIKEGTLVTVEVNEAGMVIDLHGAGSGSKKP